MIADAERKAKRDYYKGMSKMAIGGNVPPIKSIIPKGVEFGFYRQICSNGLNIPE